MVKNECQGDVVALVLVLAAVFEASTKEAKKGTCKATNVAK